MSPPAAILLRPLVRADLDRVNAIEVAASADPWSRELLAGELTGDGRDRHWLVAIEAGDQATGVPASGDPASDDQASGDQTTSDPAGGRPAGADSIVGFGGMLQVVDEAHVMNLAVDPTRRRRGVATHLLAALLLEVGDRGATSATLEVRTGNRAAIELYRRFGFESAGCRPRYYADGEDAEIMWCHRIDRRERRDRFTALASLAATSANQARTIR